ncbi:hypothetical protein ACOMHN_048579 [Nucella lapillus]
MGTVTAASSMSPFGVNWSLISYTSKGHCRVIDGNTSVAWDSKESVLSYETEQVVYLIHSLGIIPVLFVTGAPLNLLNMLVFFKQGLSDRINVCLFSLALVDLLYLILVFVFNVARAYWRLAEGQWADAAFRYSINSGLLGLYGISYAAFVLSALISMERCVCVLFPLKARRCISTRAMVMIIVLSVLTLIGLRFVVLARLKVVCLYKEPSGRVEWAVSMNAFYFRNKALIDHLESVFFGFIVVVGSSIVVLVTTVITAIRLQQTLRWRHQTSSTLSSKEIGVVKMILCLSIEFIILSLPKIVLRFSTLISPHLTPVGMYRNLYNILVSVVEFSSYVSSVVNFFVYYFCSSKYRETLRGLLSLKRKEQNTNLSICNQRNICSNEKW